MSQFYKGLRETSSAYPNGSESRHPSGSPLSGNDERNGGVGAHNPWLDARYQELERSHAIGSHIVPAGTASLSPATRVITNTPDQVVVEHYRRLRTKIMQQHALQPFRCLMVTSPSPQEGKTVTTLNLALSFGMVPAFRIVVVDGDMRLGSLGHCVGLNDRPGLGNLVEGSATLDDIVFQLEDHPGVYFIGRGNAKMPAAELLHSPRLSASLRILREKFDLVLLDSPPINLVSDTQLLGNSSDAVLLVARALTTRRKALEKAARELQSFRIIGTVLNGGTPGNRYDGGYHSYYYTHPSK